MTFYVSYNFMFQGRQGIGDIRINSSRPDGKSIELSWETLETFKKVISNNCEKYSGFRPSIITFNMIKELDEHNPDIELTIDADIEA